MRKESYFKGSQKDIKTGALELKLSNEKKNNNYDASAQVKEQNILPLPCKLISACCQFGATGYPVRVRA